MNDTPPKAPPLYPKTHLLAASGIAALLSLALLVFPSSDVEAKRTNINLDLETPVDQFKSEQDVQEQPQATQTPETSPFAQIEDQAQEPETTATTEPETAEPAPVTAKKSVLHKEVTVSKGDTLSTLFGKVGLPATAVHEVMTSDKQAKQFSQLKNGQILQFELSPEGNLKQQQAERSGKHQPFPNRQGLYLHA
jgi:cell envelope opacity-associated protein A